MLIRMVPPLTTPLPIILLEIWGKTLEHVGGHDLNLLHSTPKHLGVKKFVTFSARHEVVTMTQSHNGTRG